jgi:hypothetical protein
MKKIYTVYIAGTDSCFFSGPAADEHAAITAAQAAYDEKYLGHTDNVEWSVSEADDDFEFIGTEASVVINTTPFEHNYHGAKLITPRNHSDYTLHNIDIFNVITVNGVDYQAVYQTGNEPIGSDYNAPSPKLSLCDDVCGARTSSFVWDLFKLGESGVLVDEAEFNATWENFDENDDISKFTREDLIRIYDAIVKNNEQAEIYFCELGLPDTEDEDEEECDDEGNVTTTYRIESESCDNDGGVMQAGFESVADAIMEADTWGNINIALTQNFDGNCWAVVNEQTSEAICYLADLDYIAEKYKIEPGEAFYIGPQRVDTYSAEEIAKLV